jgi:hypothetical protein
VHVWHGGGATVTDAFMLEWAVPDPDNTTAIPLPRLGQARRRARQHGEELKRFSDALGKALDTATRADCESAIADRARGVSLYSANGLWRALRAFYGELTEEDVGVDAGVPSGRSAS